MTQKHRQNCPCAPVSYVLWCFFMGYMMSCLDTKKIIHNANANWITGLLVTWTLAHKCCFFTSKSKSVVVWNYLDFGSVCPYTVLILHVSHVCCIICSVRIIFSPALVLHQLHWFAFFFFLFWSWKLKFWWYSGSTYWTKKFLTLQDWVVTVHFDVVADETSLRGASTVSLYEQFDVGLCTISMVKSCPLYNITPLQCSIDGCCETHTEDTILSKLAAQLQQTRSRIMIISTLYVVTRVT